MKISLNNTPRDITPETSIRQMLINEGLPLQNIAVAVNDIIVLRSKWESTMLVENDRVVVITAAYGG